MNPRGKYWQIRLDNYLKKFSNKKLNYVKKFHGGKQLIRFNFTVYPIKNGKLQSLEKLCKEIYLALERFEKDKPKPNNEEKL